MLAMRKRKEIEKEYINKPISLGERGIKEIEIELLLDIRELLINDSEYIKRLNLARVKTIDSEEELDRELHKKYKKIIEEKKE